MVTTSNEQEGIMYIFYSYFIVYTDGTIEVVTVGALTPVEA
jgi:hypothetical protein